MTAEHLEHEVANLAIRHEDSLRDVRRQLATLRDTIGEGARHRVLPFPSQSREVLTLQRQVSELQTAFDRLCGMVELMADEIGDRWGRQS